MLRSLEIAPEVIAPSRAVVEPPSIPAPVNIPQERRRPPVIDDLAWLSLSATRDRFATTPAEVDREICHLALVRPTADDDAPPANDRWM